MRPPGILQWRQPWTVSSSLYALGASLVVLMIGVAGEQLIETRASAVADTKLQMQRLDMVFAEQTARALETVDLIERDIIEKLPLGAASPRDDFDGMILRRINGVRQVAEIALSDEAGGIIASSRGTAAGELPPAGLAALALHRAAPDDGLRLSEPIRAADGAWRMLLTRRMSAKDGHFAGIAVAYVNLAYFEDFYRSVELAENGAITLLRRDGTALARYPHSDDVIGRNFAEQPPFRDILSHGVAGAMVTSSDQRNGERVLAIRALRSFPLVVDVSVDAAMALAGWRHQMSVFAIVAAGGGGAVVGLLLLLARRSRQMERMVDDLRRARGAAELANASLRVQMQERVQAEAALHQAQRIEAVGQLTGGLAHDFNNLLTVITGNIELLLDKERIEGGGPDPSGIDDSGERLAAMLEAAQRGAALTGQLLAFARRQPLAPQAVDLDAVIMGMRGLLQTALGTRIRIDMRFEALGWRAFIDPTQIELMLLNLAINARDAMPQGGVLTLATATAQLGRSGRVEMPEPGDYVMVSITDTGVGMPAEVVAKAFEPFFTTKPSGAGSGLGLSHVFGAARQSGGGVQIDSAPGVGTTVKLYLPRAQGDAAVAPASTASRAASFPATRSQPMAEVRAARPARASRATVMVVDDDMPVRTTTAMLLKNFGYTVIESSSSREALERIRQDQTINLLLTDVAMPEMSGPELARRAQQARPGLPIVFFTGFADPHAIDGPSRTQRLMRKPFRPAELSAQIEAALGDAPAQV